MERKQGVHILRLFFLAIAEGEIVVTFIVSIDHIRPLRQERITFLGLPIDIVR
jgi:hypothetical protein